MEYHIKGKLEINEGMEKEYRNGQMEKFIKDNG